MEKSIKSNSQTNHRQTVGEWLSRPFVWRIPVYQRHYAWDAQKDSAPIHLFWETMEEQTELRLKGEKSAQHYLGSVIVDNKTEKGAIDGITRYDVVDGQQRLTTIQIALLAIIKVAEKHNVGDEIGEELKKYVFVDKDLRDPATPRLQPSNFDTRQFQSILNDTYNIIWKFGSRNTSRDNAEMSRIDEAFKFFKESSDALVGRHPKRDPVDVIRSIMDTLLKGIDIVLIVLLEADNAQRIYESLNYYAKPLTTFDLIRNNVFHRVGQESKGFELSLEERLFYGDEWKQLEERYWEKNADSRKTDPSKHIEAYIARMLVTKTKKGLLFNRNSIFKTYKKCYEETSIKDVIPDIVRYTGVYQDLDLGAKELLLGQDSPDSDINFGIFYYGNWNNRDFYPVIFSIVGSRISVAEKQKMINLLESYVIRRGVCGLTSARYNLEAVTICGALEDNPNYQKLSQVLKDYDKDASVFPDNDRVLSECVGAKFYGVGFQKYVFAQIELSMYASHAERVASKDDKLSIDHILPQKWENNGGWKKLMESGDGDSETMVWMVKNYINTIGNLTLMSSRRNSAKSNDPFSDIKKFLATSGLKLNQDLAKEDVWNVKKIVARSKKLGEKICEIWPRDIK